MAFFSGQQLYYLPKSFRIDTKTAEKSLKLSIFEVCPDSLVALSPENQFGQDSS